jgi:hypothetical protein
VKRFLSMILVVCFITTSAFAQQNVTKKKSGPRRQLATIVFAGLGGAILGLSTLSFYGRPQEYLGNIAIGFAVGVIAGTTYVTFKSATTKEYYEPQDPNQQQPQTQFEKPDFLLVPVPIFNAQNQVAPGLHTEFRF